MPSTFDSFAIVALLVFRILCKAKSLPTQGCPRQLLRTLNFPYLLYNHLLVRLISIAIQIFDDKADDVFPWGRVQFLPCKHLVAED